MTAPQGPNRCALASFGRPPWQGVSVRLGSGLGAGRWHIHSPTPGALAGVADQLLWKFSGCPWGWVALVLPCPALTQHPLRTCDHEKIAGLARHGCGVLRKMYRLGWGMGGSGCSTTALRGRWMHAGTLKSLYDIIVGISFWGTILPPNTYHELPQRRTRTHTAH